MNAQSLRVCIAALLFPLATAQFARGDSEAAEEVQDYLSGRRILATYREGGPVYGTYVALSIQYCQSGRYLTYRESRKQTVMGNEQVSTWRDAGRWEVTTSGDDGVIRYYSESGERYSVRARVLPNGRLWVGAGVTVVPRGPAECR
jgi:hypothetical protein